MLFRSNPANPSAGCSAIVPASPPQALIPPHRNPAGRGRTYGNIIQARPPAPSLAAGTPVEMRVSSPNPPRSPGGGLACFATLDDLAGLLGGAPRRFRRCGVRVVDALLCGRSVPLVLVWPQNGVVMSMQPRPWPDVPELTAKMARSPSRRGTWATPWAAHDQATSPALTSPSPPDRVNQEGPGCMISPSAAWSVQVSHEVFSWTTKFWSQGSRGQRSLHLYRTLAYRCPFCPFSTFLVADKERD